MVLYVVLVLYLLLFVVGAFFAYPIIFPAPSPSYEISTDLVELKTSNGDSVAAREIEFSNSDIWIIFNHGNGVDIGIISDFLERIPEKSGCSVIAYDYPGYGRSSGTPTEKSVLAAAEAVYERLKSRGVPGSKIVVWGRSIGGGPATWLAHRHKVAGLILESAFKSAFRVVSGVKILPFDRFDNLALIDSVDCPKLFIHGRRDKVISFSHGETMYEKAKPPKTKFWLDNAGHNDVESVGGEEYWRSIRKLVRQSRKPEGGEVATQKR